MFPSPMLLGLIWEEAFDNSSHTKWFKAVVRNIFLTTALNKKTKRSIIKSFLTQVPDYFHHTGKNLGSVLQHRHICKNPQTRCFLYNVDVGVSCLCLDESRLCRYVRLPGECNSNTTSKLEYFTRKGAS